MTDDLPPRPQSWTIINGTEVDIVINGREVTGVVQADPDRPSVLRVVAPNADVPAPPGEMLDLPGGPSLWLAARIDNGTPMISRVDADGTGLNCVDGESSVGDIGRLRSILGGLLNYAGDLNHERLADATRARVQRENDRRTREETAARRSVSGRVTFTNRDPRPLFGEAAPE